MVRSFTVLLSVALAANCFLFVNAETRTRTQWDPALLSDGMASAPQLGVIRGRGFVDFSHVLFEPVDMTGNQLEDSDTQDYYLDVTVLSSPTPYFAAGEIASMSTVDQLTRVGIGKMLEPNKDLNQTFGVFKFCCDDEAVAAELCQPEQLGHPLVVSEKDEDALDNSPDISFEPFNVPVSFNGSFAAFPLFGLSSYDETTYVALVVGNCKTENKLAVAFDGPCIWVSYVGGKAVIFLLVLSSLHFTLTLWYSRLMRIHQSSRIRLESVLRMTLVLALVSVALQTIVYAVESVTSIERVGLLVLASVMAAVRDVASRCLYVCVAMGWGITVPSLATMPKVCLSILGSTLLISQVVVFSLEHISWVNLAVELFFIPIWQWSNFAFMIWIPTALLNTMRHLKEENTDSPKLQRYRYMMYVFIFAVFLNIVQLFLFVGDMIYESGRRFDGATNEQINQMTYFLIIALIAYLWRPNPQARQFGYTLVTDGDGLVVDDGDDDDYDHGNNKVGDHELELTEVVDSKAQELI